MKNYLFSYLTVFFGFGIFIAEKLNPGTNLRIYLIVCFFLCFTNLLIKNKPLRNGLFLLQFTFLGIWFYQAHNSTPNDKVEVSNQPQILPFILLEQQKTTEKYERFKAKDLVHNQYSLLQIPLDSNSYYPNDTVYIYGKQYPLQAVKNPNQFDYSAYLKHQNIQSTIYADVVIMHQSNHQHWRKLAAISKERIRLKLKELGYTTEARSLISSMLLGDRTEISEEINQNYIATGVVHILSISGLHVVMIYMILQFVLQPLTYLKEGKRIQLIASLLIIWVFAFYVELEAPVFRSALMISIYYISELLKRPKNIYHTLSLSAFILLVSNPNFLFDVGFQLSFSAVFFIVWLHPIYAKIYQPKQQFNKYIYDLCATSISAQLGTMPFTSLYFNQFSGLFLFGNIFLVPASFLIIIGGIIAILFNYIPFDFSWFIIAFNWFVSISNRYIQWLATYDQFVWKNVYISTFTAVLILIILFSIRPLILEKSKRAFVVILIAFTSIQFNRWIDINRIQNSHEIVIFHQYKSSLIGLRNGQNLTIFSSEILDSNRFKNYIIRPYQLQNRIRNTSYFHLDSVVNRADYKKTKSFLITPKTTIFVGENLEEIPQNTDYLLVRNSTFQPKNFDHLGQIKRVIADGSNYPNYVSELDSILRFHSDSILWNTSERGYFSIKF